MDVAKTMLRYGGLNMGTHIGGVSVHNQHIERLWRGFYWRLSFFLHSFLYKKMRY